MDTSDLTKKASLNFIKFVSLNLNKLWKVLKLGFHSYKYIGFPTNPFVVIVLAEQRKKL